MSVVAWLNPCASWIKLGAWVLVVAGAMWYADTRRAGIERAACLAKENKALTQAIDDNAKANDERRAAQKEVDRLASLPPKVVKSVRDNPSGCSLHPVVADSLRDQINKTNDAIRAVP